MKLFAISPINYSTLIYGFAVEAVFLFLSVFAFSAICLIIYKFRVNIHLKIMGVFLMTQCFPFMVARVFILGYQFGFYFNGQPPESSSLVVASSWWRAYHLLLVLTTCTWLSVEREISLYYIYDYEYEHRWWIPTFIIILAAIVCGLGATCYTFEWLPLYSLIFILVSLAVAGVLLYWNNYKRTKILNDALKKRKPCKLEYCLSMIRNALTTMSLANFFTAIAFILIYLPYFEPETHQLMDCLFNILVAANGPIVGFGVFFHNTYMVGLLKKFFGRESVKPIDDEGDFYFGQLMQQWDEHFDVH